MQPQEEDIVFGATLLHVKFLRQILKALTIVDDVIFEVEEQGVRLTVEEGRCVQASLYIPHEWFADYFVKPNPDKSPITFAVNLSSLTSCLRMTTDDNCKLIIIYSGNAFPMVLAFNGTENNVSIEAELKTKTFEETLNFHMHTMPTEYNRVLMSGTNFSMLFNEIDVSPDEIEILLSPQEPFLLLRATCNVQAKATVQVAKTSNTIIRFNCPREITARYRSSHIRFASKCLSFAQTVALTLYTTGLLSIEILIGGNHHSDTTGRRSHQTTSNISPDGPSAVLKYFITPLFENTDESDF